MENFTVINILFWWHIASNAIKHYRLNLHLIQSVWHSGLADLITFWKQCCCAVSIYTLYWHTVLLIQIRHPDVNLILMCKDRGLKEGDKRANHVIENITGILLDTVVMKRKPQMIYWPYWWVSLHTPAALYPLHPSHPRSPWHLTTVLCLHQRNAYNTL